MSNATVKDRWLSEETMVKNSNTPFGLGWDVHVLTDHPEARQGHFVSTGRLYRMVQAVTGRDSGEFAAISIKYEATQSYVIVIFRSNAGVDVTPGRVIELICHECSHVADCMFSAGELVPCTETRAYTIDWLVRMAGAAVLPALWEYKILR